MKAGGWGSGCDRFFAVGVDCLIPVFVVRIAVVFAFSLDVGRQRHLPQCLGDTGYRGSLGEFEADSVFGLFVFFFDCSGECILEGEGGADG